MPVSPSMPYFDYLLELLAQKNASVEKGFGRHVHWGFWPDPAAAICDDDDYARAAERLTLELCEAAAIGAGERVLDAGCGFGGTVASLNERLDGMRLVGVNIDERQLERARQLVVARPGNTITFEASDACALSLADGSFDRVLAVECIFHFPSRERFFAEAFRVLRPGGTLALSDFVPMAVFLPLVRLCTEARVLAKLQIFGPLNVRYSLRHYQQLASRTGFELVMQRDITRNTLPTYTYISNLLLGSAALGGVTERIARTIVPLLRLAGGLGAVRYELLAFRKPERD